MLLVERRHVADVALGIRIVPALERALRDRSAGRSCSASSDARRSRFSFSNSVAGNAGSRSASAASRSSVRQMRAHASGRAPTSPSRRRRWRASRAACRARPRTPAGRACCVPRASIDAGEAAARRLAHERLLVALSAAASEAAPSRRASSSAAARPSCRSAARTAACAPRGSPASGRTTSPAATRGIALVVLDHRRDVDGGRRRRAIGLRVGDEQADRPVRRLEVLERHALHVGRASPCASGRAAGRTAASRRARSTPRSPRRALRIVERLVEVPAAPCARTRSTSASVIGFALTPSTRGDAARRARRRANRPCGTCAQKMMSPGSCSTKFHDFDGARLLGLDERLVQPARGLDGHDLAQRLASAIAVRMRAGHRVVERADELRAADAANGDRALAVLHRLLACRARAASRVGLRDRAERTSRSARASRSASNLPGDDQHRVVGLVVDACRTPAAARCRRSRCRSARRSSSCRSCASRTPSPASRSSSTRCGLFSPLSNSLRTTVISVSRSFFATNEFTIRSASIASAQSRFSSDAVNVSK